MDWSNEDYVRVYTRDTADDLELSWQAMALFHAMLRKFDRSGLIAVRNGWSSVARIVRIPEDVVVAAGRELEADGRVRRTKHGMFAPNFTEAQTARKSDKARQKESRDRRRSEAAEAAETAEPDQVAQTQLQPLDTPEACHTESHVGHDVSHGVTLCSALPPAADPLLRVAEREVAPALPYSPRAKRKRRCRIPDDWGPREVEQLQAKAAGFEPAAIAAAFKRHFRASGKTYLNWDETFAAWIEREIEFRSRTGGRAPTRPGTLFEAAMEAAERADARERAGGEP